MEWETESVAFYTCAGWLMVRPLHEPRFQCVPTMNTEIDILWDIEIQEIFFIERLQSFFSSEDWSNKKMAIYHVDDCQIQVPDSDE